MNMYSIQEYILKSQCISNCSHTDLSSLITPYLFIYDLCASNPRIVVISPTCEQCVSEIVEESENDTWSTISSTDSSGRFGGSEKDLNIRCHAPTNLHERCCDHSSRKFSQENNTSHRGTLEINNIHYLEKSTFWSFLHVSKNKYKHYTIHIAQQNWLISSPFFFFFWLHDEQNDSDTNSNILLFGIDWNHFSKL